MVNYLLFQFRSDNMAKFDSIINANHFYKGKMKELSFTVERYLKDKITVF